jgi:hypothetical protein
MELPLKRKKALRTKKQNDSLHLWFDLLSKTFVENAIDMKILLSKYQMDVPVTPEMVKEYLWRRVQVSMYGKKSTTELTTDEVSKIYDVINRFLADNFKIHVPFPSAEYNFLDDIEI